MSTSSQRPPEKSYCMLQFLNNAVIEIVGFPAEKRHDKGQNLMSIAMSIEVERREIVSSSYPENEQIVFKPLIDQHSLPIHSKTISWKAHTVASNVGEAVPIRGPGCHVKHKCRLKMVSRTRFHLLWNQEPHWKSQEDLVFNLKNFVQSFQQAITMLKIACSRSILYSQ